MFDPIAIQYREFYDVPRVFVAAYDGVTFVFDASFDDGVDDYPDQYAIYTLPTVAAADLAGPWDALRSRAVRHLGTMPVSAVRFDPTRRQSIDRGVMQAVAGRMRAVAGH